MDSGNGIVICQGGNSRLLDEDFESKSIKEKSKNSKLTS